MLCRNFMQHLDNNFRFMCLEQYFLQPKHQQRADGAGIDDGLVPRVLVPRSLPEYPVKPVYSPEQSGDRRRRLERIVSSLYDLKGETPPPPAPLLSLRTDDDTEAATLLQQQEQQQQQDLQQQDLQQQEQEQQEQVRLLVHSDDGVCKREDTEEQPST